MQYRHSIQIKPKDDLLNEKEKEVAILNSTNLEYKNRMQMVENSLQQERAMLLKLTADHASLTAKNTELQTRLEEQKSEIEQLQQRFKIEFENLANKILEEKSHKFTEQNRVNLDLILNPLKEKIKDFEDKVEKTYTAESSERISLKEQIKYLLDLNKQLSSEANNLATALKGNNKMQGNWGELVLEKILESSGLTKDAEYKTQVVTSNNEGDTIKPDVIVFLPDQKHIIIDSKVSLNAYNDFVSSTDPVEKTNFALMHTQSVRNHIKLLSDKSYQTATGFQSPDFVLMFMPIESAFSLALQTDATLYHYAWDRKIIIVSPTTLLATLRTIANIWKQDKQVRNALQIAEEGGKMYDKLVLLVNDLIDIGKKMEATKADYVAAMNKLTDGPGNLINRAQKMRDLGAKSQKNLPQQLIERAGE
jgi:DNA recombination protein RmuC